MAILTPSQLTSASNATYFNNTSGSITPTSVRTLNDNWISSSILVSQTSSLSVLSASYAGTASVLLGSIASASFATSASYALTSSFAVSSSRATTASFAISSSQASTASFVLSSSYAGTASVLLGSVVSASYAAFASNAGNATTADSAVFATTAGTANSAVTASYVALVATASFSTTASFALNFNPSATASFAISASYAVSSSTALTSSFASTASFVQTAQTASYVANAVSASNSISSSYSITSSLALNAETSSFVLQAVSASYASYADLLDGFNFTAFLFTSSFNTFSSSVSTRFGLAPTLAGDNTFTGNNIFGNVTASNALITSASVINLTVVYETASVIYSSGSNQFGDASDDVQTLWGTVDVKTGPLRVTGSMFISGNINMVNGSDLVTHHVRAQGSNGLELQTSNGTNIVQMGAGGGTQAAFVGAVTAATFAGSGSGVIGVVTSSFAQTASFAVSSSNTISSSFAVSSSNTVSASFATIANSVNILSQSLTITGSFNGLVVSQSIASSTSSLNFETANFFTSAVSASTFFNITNPKAGETVNLLLTTVGVATASFSSNVKQVSGSRYTPTSGSGKNDIITFISFDGTSVYLANVKNLV